MAAMCASYSCIFFLRSISIDLKGKYNAIRLMVQALIPLKLNCASYKFVENE